MSLFGKKKKRENSSSTISPDEIFLDSKNIPNFDSHQFEGRMEKPIGFRVFIMLGAIFLLIGSFLYARIGYLQIIKGDEFSNRAENNHLRLTPIAAERGLIYDKNGELLAWNTPNSRTYKNLEGLAHIVGYTGISYEKIIGKAGVEKSYEEILGGVEGTKIIETDSKNKIQSESIQKSQKPGESIYLSIDARVQNKLYG